MKLTKIMPVPRKFTKTILSILNEVALYCLIILFISIAFYAFTGYFSNPILNIALIILDIFILYHILDFLDKRLHFGAHRKQNNSDDSENEDFHNTEDENIINPDDFS